MLHHWISDFPTCHSYRDGAQFLKSAGMMIGTTTATLLLNNRKVVDWQTAVTPNYHQAMANGIWDLWEQCNSLIHVKNYALKHEKLKRDI